MAACREIPFIPYYGSVDANASLRDAAGRIPTVDGRPRPGSRALALSRARAGLDRRTGGEWRLSDLRTTLAHRSGQSGMERFPRRDHACLRRARGAAHRGGRGPGIQVRPRSSAAPSCSKPSAGRRRGPRCEKRARHLRARFDADFWLDREAFYALALDGEGAPCRVIASNPAHCLWTGIAAGSRARAVGGRLMAEDMFSGWACVPSRPESGSTTP